MDAMNGGFYMSLFRYVTLVLSLIFLEGYISGYDSMKKYALIMPIGIAIIGFVVLALTNDFIYFIMIMIPDFIFWFVYRVGRKFVADEKLALALENEATVEDKK
ncbi:MAG: hypothetical protein R3Y53_03140 [Bacillota bacterium]